MVYDFPVGVRVVDKGDCIVFEKHMLENRETFEVRGAGVDFVRLIDGKRDLDQILEECIKIYGPNVEPYILAKDIERFFGDLIFDGLIRLVPAKEAE